MSGALNVRRSLRLALVSCGIATVVLSTGSAAFADGPSVAPSTPAAAAPAPAVSGAPSAVASSGPVVRPSGAPTAAVPGAPQVTAVPKGGAQTGEGTTGRSTGTLVAGGALGAAGVAAIGFAVARRRAGAQG